MRSSAPHRASFPPLQDPWWWAALALWLLNDHVLKGSPLLPSIATGKISDICGLFVLPAALGALARPQSLRAIPYLAVGLYFSGIQLFASWATGSEALLAAIGVPSRITPDPSDLFALPALIVAWLRYEGPVLDPLKGAAPRRALALPGYALLLFATVATSRVDGNSGVQRTGRIFLYNATGNSQQVTLRQLRPDVGANCFAIQDNPSAHLRAGLFEATETLTVEAGSLLALDARVDSNLDPELEDKANACNAMVIDGPLRAPSLVFWTPESFPLKRFVDSQGDLNVEGMIALEESNSGNDEQLQFRHLGEISLLHPLSSEAPPKASPECAPPDSKGSLGWGEDFPQGPHKLLSVKAGADGCLSLELGHPEKKLQTRRYLCIPADHFPFTPGSTIQFRSLKGEAAILGDNIEGWRISPPESAPLVELWIVLGQGLPEIRSLSFGVKALDECPFASSQEECLTLSRPVRLLVRSTSSGKEVELRANGASNAQIVSDKEVEWSLELLEGEERSVLDGSCSGDRIRGGLELQLIATRRRVAP